MIANIYVSDISREELIKYNFQWVVDFLSFIDFSLIIYLNILMGKSMQYLICMDCLTY